MTPRYRGALKGVYRVIGVIQGYYRTVQGLGLGLSETIPVSLVVCHVILQIG